MSESDPIVADLRRRYPGFRDSDVHVTSPKDPRYNCVAWAMGDITRKWVADPGLLDDPELCVYGHWPEGVPLEDTLRGWIAMFESQGFERCRTARLQRGFEKIAVYGAGQRPRHVALQKPDGFWTSKLGEGNDIEHALEGLNDSKYGRVLVVMRRRRQS